MVMKKNKTETTLGDVVRAIESMEHTLKTEIAEHRKETKAQHAAVMTLIRQDRAKIARLEKKGGR